MRTTTAGLSLRLPRREPASLLFCAAAAALLLLASAPPPPDPRSENASPYVRLGRMLLDRLPPAPGFNPAYRMPLTTVPAASLESPAAARAAQALLAAAFGLLLAALAALAGSTWLALPAAVLWVLGADGRQVLADHPQGVFTLCVLAVAACAAARAALPPSRASALALAAALGASLLCRSPLALLPVLLFLVERRESRRRAGAWLVLLGPFAFLLPWIAANAVMLGRFLPFEDGAASDNLIGGALGLVGSHEGDAQALLPPAVDFEDNAALWRWALGEAASHPLRTLLGAVRRVSYAAQLAPLPFLLGAAGAYAWRRDPARRAVALVAGYFLAAHCALSVQENYFFPLWPLASLLAATLLLPPSGAREPSVRAGARAASGGAALLAALALACLAVVGRYASAHGRLRLTAREDAASCPPGAAQAAALDAAGLAAQASRRLEEDARAHAARAVVRGPRDAAAQGALKRLASTRPYYERLPLCWPGPAPRLAALLAGPAAEDYWALAQRARLLLDAGQDASAELDALEARAGEPLERAALPALLARAGRHARGAALQRELALPPPPEREARLAALAAAGRREALRREVAELAAVGACPWRWEVEVALEEKELGRALAAADAAPSPHGPEPFLPGLIAAAARAGAPELTLRLAARGGSALPPAARLDEGEAAGALGRAERAFAALSHLEREELSPAVRRRAASAAEKAGLYALARRLLEPLLGGGDGGDWLAAARLDARLGDAPAALAALVKAETLRLTPAQRRQAALQLQAAGRPAEAAERLGRLAAAAPRDAALQADHGVALFLSGRREQGEAALAAASRLPGAPPGVFLSLAEARSALGDLPGAEAARAEGARRCRDSEGPCGALR